MICDGFLVSVRAVSLGRNEQMMSQWPVLVVTDGESSGLILRHNLEFLNLLNFSLCLSVFCLLACLCSACMSGSDKGQKRSLDHLILEWQKFVCGCLVLEIELRSSGREARVPNHWALYPALLDTILKDINLQGHLNLCCWFTRKMFSSVFSWRYRFIHFFKRIHI